MVCDVGVEMMLKSLGGTVTEALAVWVAVVPDPVIVNEVVVGPAFATAVRVSVELPPAVTLVELKLPVTPDGSPEIDSVMFCAAPDTTAVLMVYVVLAPAGTVRDVGLGVMLKSLQLGSLAWAGTLTASQAALTVLNSAQLPGNKFLAACNVQVRYFKYELPVVFISIALYRILIALCTPRPTTGEPLQVGLVGCPLVGFEPSASK
jgi:hypothetical protein